MWSGLCLSGARLLRRGQHDGEGDGDHVRHVVPRRCCAGARAGVSLPRTCRRGAWSGRRRGRGRAGPCRRHGTHPRGRLGQVRVGPRRPRAGPCRVQCPAPPLPPPAHTHVGMSVRGMATERRDGDTNFAVAKLYWGEEGQGDATWRRAPRREPTQAGERGNSFRVSSWVRPPPTSFRSRHRAGAVFRYQLPPDFASASPTLFLPVELEGGGWS